MVSVLLFIIEVFLGVSAFLIGVLCTIKSEFRAPKSYRIIYFSMTIALLLLSTLLSLKIGYFFTYEGEVLAVLFLLNAFIFIVELENTNCKKGREISSLKQMFFRHKVTEEDLKYQNMTSEEFAKLNKIEYIPDVIEKELYDLQIKKYVAKDNKYILLYPYKSGNSVSPIYWYGEKEKKYFFILDNKGAFNRITNLEEILLDIIKLYSTYIDEDIFIDFCGFALKLEGNIKEDYKGPASLVITENVIRNKDIDYEDKHEAKKYYLNSFIIHFIGWNFGRVVRNNRLLESTLMELKKLAAERDIYDRV